MVQPRRQESAEAPEEELPQLRTLTIGAAVDGHLALLWVTSRGQKVLARELLDVGPPSEIDNAWREEAYHRVWRQEPEHSAQAKLATAERVAPLRGDNVIGGHGFGLCRKSGSWALYELEHQGDRITRQSVIETSKDFLYMWERFDVVTARTLVQQDRRKT